MPFIITTTFTWKSSGARNTITDSRRAVATLDEMRNFVGNVVLDAYRPHGNPVPDAMVDAKLTHCGDAENVPEFGGTIGPLPDGTVIAVVGYDWEAFREMSGAVGRYRTGRAATIAAFNAAQEAGR